MIFLKQDYSMELYSNTNLLCRNTIYSQKKMFKKAYYGNKSLSLA